MKGLPGWLFAAGSALPLRLRTAALRRATSLGSLALLRAGLLESAPAKRHVGETQASGLPAQTASGR